jgi:hypothetical protein
LANENRHDIILKVNLRSGLRADMMKCPPVFIPAGEQLPFLYVHLVIRSRERIALGFEK